MKIQNGDYEYSPYLRESIDEENKLSIKSTMIIFRTHIVKMNNLLNMKHQYKDEKNQDFSKTYGKGIRGGK